MKKAFIAAAVALAIGLSACAGDAADPDPDQRVQTPVTVTPQSPDATTVEPTAAEPEEPALDYEPIDMGTPPAEMTAPGTAMALGQTAWVTFEYPPGGEEPDTASPAPEASPTVEMLTSVAGVAVLDIVQGDQSYWDRFSNAEEFAGRIPYFVVHQEKRDVAAFPDGAVPLDLWPQYADGTDAEFVAITGVTRSDDCGFELPEPDIANGIRVECFIAIGEADRPVTRVTYNGLDQFAIVYDETDIYVEQPLVWSAP